MVQSIMQASASEPPLSPPPRVAERSALGPRPSCESALLLYKVTLFDNLSAREEAWAPRIQPQVAAFVTFVQLQ